jgi:hypothetical protein
VVFQDAFYLTNDTAAHQKFSIYLNCKKNITILSPSFEIQSSIADTLATSLIVEVGLHGINYVVINNDAACMALAAYHFPAGSDADAGAAYLKEIVSAQPLLQQPFGKITIIYAYPYSILVPHQYMKHELKKEMLELIYGDVHDADIKADYMYRHQLYNVYSVPKQVESVVGYLFSADNSTHLYSLLPDVLKETGDNMYCIFNSNHFTGMLMKAGKLQLMQTFDYKTPEDVAYHLLHLCESFDVKASEATLHLNGMIDTSSSLYQEIGKYFMHLKFGTLPGNFSYPEGMDEYPPHFFSHLFALASCV